MCPLRLDNDFGSPLPADYGSINTETGALDTINRYGLERASRAQTLLKERHWDYKGVDMDYKMKETVAYDDTCTLSVRKNDNAANK